MTRRVRRTRRLRGAAWVAGALCAAFLTGLAVGPAPDASGRPRRDPMQGFFPVEMPRYPGAAETPMGGEARFGGSPMWTSSFSTPDGPVRVGGLYAAAWRAAGLRVRESVTSQGGTVSAFDPATATVRQVLLLRRGSTTWAFPSVTRDPHRLLQPVEDADVPVYPGATPPMGFSSADAGRRLSLASWQAEAPRGEVEAFVRGGLAARGWTVEAADPAGRKDGGDHRVIVLRRGEQELTVGLTRAGPRRTRALFTKVSP